ncbi:MAG TPA: rhodanese-like domain-containing protein [Flavobacterium sp.]|jgi:rhodanese-related sulfurtransferase|nr:rhodanese-like domain-containing protein [Flavobacterium sp.]
MKKRYIFLALVPIVLAIVLVFLPDKSNSIDAKRNQKNLKSAKYTGVTPNNLLLESVNSNRFIQPDELAKVIIGQDPSYLLVDLRDAAQFEKFTLPGAINIPYEKILTEENQAVFDSKAYSVVLFSNGTIVPDQVWMILRRAGIKNLKVLNGGLNQFYQLYLNPPKPTETDPKEAFENYSFRKAVGAHLGLPNPDEFIPKGGINVQNNTVSTEIKPVAQPSVKTTPKVVAPKKVEGGDEGC